MQLSPRRIVQVTLRLSVVAAIVAGLVEAYRQNAANIAERDRRYELRRGYECAATKRNEDLLKAQSVYGTINMKGAPFFCSTSDFWVGLDEVERVRQGTLTFEPVLDQRWSWEQLAVATLLGFLGTNLLGGLIAGTWIVCRWMLRPIVSCPRHARCSTTRGRPGAVQEFFIKAQYSL